MFSSSLATGGQGEAMHVPEGSLSAQLATFISLASRVAHDFVAWQVCLIY